MKPSRQKRNSRRSVNALLKVVRNTALGKTLSQGLRWAGSDLQIQDIGVYRIPEHITSLVPEDYSICLFRDSEGYYYFTYNTQDILEGHFEPLRIRSNHPN